MREEEELAKYYAAIPNDTEVLITHCPPFGILDRNEDDGRCGSTALLERIGQLSKLKRHIFGHMHGSYGIEERNGVTFHNVASLNEMYRYQNPPHVIEI
jgi:Icc-related predicted phosphoesterase